MVWSAFSPDLNPIEAVWNTMKNYIQYEYPDLGNGKVQTLDQLPVILREAWDSISTDELRSLILSIPDRCRAVVDAKGGSTKY